MLGSSAIYSSVAKLPKATAKGPEMSNLLMVKPVYADKYWKVLLLLLPPVYFLLLFSFLLTLFFHEYL